MSTLQSKKWFLPILSLIFADAALAHPVGQAAGIGGWMHPFSGLDHLLAMVGVGIWSARQGGWARLAFPGAFLVGVLSGGVLGAFGVRFSWTETAVMGSVILLGFFLLAAISWKGIGPLVIAVLFGTMHGHAHGSEMAYSTILNSQFLGFLGGTAFLHLIGVGVGETISRLKFYWMYRLSGALMLAWVAFTWIR